MYPNHPFCPNCGVENKADAIVENEVSVGTPAEATARPTENAVSEPAVMHFEWAGTSKGKKSWVMSVVINYVDAAELTFVFKTPICSAKGDKSGKCNIP